MSLDEKRTLEELAARYDLEPTLRDVYVEGAFDAGIVAWLLRQAECHSAAVYEIDTVNIPPEILARHKLDDGNKGRVIALCFELQGSIKSRRQVSGVIDRDYDSFIGRFYNCELLLQSDFACMEMYFFDQTVLKRYCHHILRLDEEWAGRLMTNLSPILQDLFFIRSANESLQLKMKWLEPYKQCTTPQKGAVQLDVADFIKRYLNKSGKSGEEARFVAEVVAMKAKANSNHRHQMNGHDFIQLLSRCVHSLSKNKSLADYEVVERTLTTCCDYRELAKHSLFAGLIERASA